MKAALVLFAVSSLLVRAGLAESLPQAYSAYGELILTQLVCAPFPAPSRAQGHVYRTTADGKRQEKFYSARDHYSDSTVAIFIPKGFRETGRIDFVVHFHGWRNHVASVLKTYRLIEQLSESGRNAVLVVPQGPRDAPDSAGGKLEEPDGFKRFMDEVMTRLRGDPNLKRRDFALGNIILSGHSGGYQVMASILDRGGLTSHVKEVWLFDALYARTRQFLGWLDTSHGRLLDIYTLHGGTKEETERLMEILKQRGTPFFSGKEGGISPEDLRPRRPCFLFSDLPHNDVVAKHESFRLFLETSCLEKIDE